MEQTIPSKDGYSQCHHFWYELPDLDLKYKATVVTFNPHPYNMDQTIPFKVDYPLCDLL